MWAAKAIDPTFQQEDNHALIIACKELEHVDSQYIFVEQEYCCMIFVDRFTKRKVVSFL